MIGPRDHTEHHDHHGDLGRVVGYWVADDLVQQHILAGWEILTPHAPPDRPPEFTLMRAPEEVAA